MNVPSFHQAEHFAGVAAYLESLAIEVAGKRVECRHNVGDSAITVIGGMRRFSLLGFFPDAGIGLANHLLAEVDSNEVILKDVVIEHILGSFAKIYNPLSERRWPDAKRHILSVRGAGGMIVAADSANSTGDKVRVARVLTFHEDAVAAEDRRSAMALRHLPVFEVDLCVNTQAAHDSGNRVPVHLY